MSLPAKPSAGRRLLASGSVYTAAQLTNQALVFLLLPLYAHKLGSHGLGAVEITNAARRVLSIVFLQGLSISWFRLRRLHKTAEERRSFEATVVWYLVASGLVFAGVLCLCSEQVTRWLMPGVPFFPLGLLTIVAAATVPYQTLLERELLAQQQTTRLAVFSVVRTLLTLLVIVWFVAGLERGVAGKVEAEAIAGGLMAIWAFIGLSPAPPSRVRVPQLKSALGFGLPKMPQELSGLVNDMVDRVLISAALGLAAVGVYSVGYRIAAASMLFMNAINLVFAPMFVDEMHDADEKERAGHEKEAQQIRHSVALTGLGMVVLACVLAQGITASGREVMELLTPEQAAGAFPVLGPVSLGAVAWCCHRMFAQSVFYDLGAGRMVAVIGTIGAAANIVFNLLLIPVFGIMGAAWATLLSNALFAVLSYRVGMHYRPVPYDMHKWLRVSAWTALSVFAFYVCDASSLSLWERLGAKLVLLSVSLGVTAALSGITVATLRSLFFGRAR